MGDGRGRAWEGGGSWGSTPGGAGGTPGGEEACPPAGGAGGSACTGPDGSGAHGGLGEHGRESPLGREDCTTVRVVDDEVDSLRTQCKKGM